MENKDKLTVLVTGFGPYADYKTNPSWEAVKLLPDLFENQGVSKNVDLIVTEISVSYEIVETKMKELIEKYNPSIVVHVGVSHASYCLNIEKQACSKGYTKPDVFDKYRNEDNVDHVVLKSNCNIEDICEAVNKHSDEINCKAVASDDAGRYLCEYIYYQSLSRGVPQVIFVHVPKSDIYSSEQTARGLLKIVLHLIECAMCNKAS